MVAIEDNKDRFSISYTLWVGALFLLYSLGNDLDRIFNLYFLLVPLMLLPTMAVAIAWIVWLIRNSFLRRWRRLASVIVAPFVAYGFFILLGMLDINPDQIRFEFTQQSYLKQIAEKTSSEPPRLEIFLWGTTGGAAVTNTLDYLIYDESDEVGLPVAQRSAEWKSRAGAMCPGTFMCAIIAPPPQMAVKIKRMRRHFFLATAVW
jgi:hypothetical protein